MLSDSCFYKRYELIKNNNQASEIMLFKLKEIIDKKNEAKGHKSAIE